MSSAAQWLAIGTPISIVVCIVAYIQIRHWRRPPRTPYEAERRAWWDANKAFPALGVRVRDDGWVYTIPGQRPVAQLAGVKAAVSPAPMITKGKPRTGIAVLTFPDGTEHRHRYPIKHHLAAAAQALELNTRGQARTTGRFARTTGAVRPWAVQAP